MTTSLRLLDLGNELLYVLCGSGPPLYLTAGLDGYKSRVDILGCIITRRGVYIGSNNEQP